jgi:hypothetical protein
VIASVAGRRRIGRCGEVLGCAEGRPSEVAVRSRREGGSRAGVSNVGLEDEDSGAESVSEYEVGMSRAREIVREMIKIDRKR